MFSDKNVKKIYILGIGGSSMQAIANILKSQGYDVLGYDSKYGKYFKTLATIGITVDFEIDFDKVKQCDMLIYSLAFSEDFPLISYAKEIGKIVLNRQQFLKIFSSNFKEVVAISGTHGKSTTSYLTSCIFNSENFSATYHIGATSNEFVTGGLCCGSDYLITEACEYKDCFFAFNPTVAVVLNIEKDHPDYFKSEVQLYNSFMLFASRIKQNGLLILPGCLREKFSKYLASINRCDIEIITFGEGGNYIFTNSKNGINLLKNGKFIGEFYTNLNGYNIYNNIVSIIIALHYNMSVDKINKGLLSVTGLDRRYQHLPLLNGAEVILDYAHHPSEIKMVIDKARANCARLVVCFQPHTYSRTTALFDDFVNCFSKADEVIITKTYKSRDKIPTKTSFDLFVKISEKVTAKYFDDFLSIATYLKSSIKNGERLLILGAGDIDELANLLI